MFLVQNETLIKHMLCVIHYSNINFLVHGLSMEISWPLALIYILAASVKRYYL